MKLLLLTGLLLLIASDVGANDSPFVSSCKDTHRKLLIEFVGNVDSFAQSRIDATCPEIAQRITAQNGWAHFKDHKRDGCQAAIVGAFQGFIPDSDHDKYFAKYCK